MEGDATGKGSLKDPYFCGIFNSDGVLLNNTANDDGGVGLNSQFTFTPAETGTYYLAAGSYRGTGSYTLSIVENEAPSP